MIYRLVFSVIKRSDFHSQDHFGYLEYTEREHDEIDGHLAYIIVAQ